MLMLGETELLHIIEQGETATVEFKLSPPRPTELAERLCGMANAQGGLVIIGVEDVSLKIVGIRDVRLAVDVALRAARQIIPALVLDPPEPEIYTIDDKRLMVVNVPSSNQGPLHQSSGVFWIRRGTHTIPLNLAEVLEITNDRGLISWELQPVSQATIEDIDLEQVKSYLNLRSVRSHSNSRFKDFERVLLGLGCATMIDSGQIVPTNAGILFFSSDPQRYLPQSEVVCVVYNDEWGVRGYVERKIITGTLKQVIDDSEEFLRIYMDKKKWVAPDNSTCYFDAVREAIVNAVVHRDYSRYGECIRIFFYSDRVEVRNPGLLLPGITIEHMKQGEAVSRLRNPILVNLLRDIPGYVERIGSGIRLMFSEMKSIGLAEPQLRQVSEFLVTFYAAPMKMETSSEESLLENNEQYILNLNRQEDIDPLSFNGLLSQEHRLEVALRYVQEHGAITNREHRELTGASENTAHRDLGILVSRETLKRVGKRRGSQYTFP